MVFTIQHFTKNGVARLPMWLAPLILAAVGAGLLWRLKGPLQETTLLHPWAWTLLAVWLVAIVEAAASAFDFDDASRSPLRFAAAAATFCPVMALLGARRPHHHAWQFIVLSLWVVLALPSAEALVISRGMEFEVRGLRAVFVIALIALGPLNYLPTRNWAAALLAALGQTCLLAPHLPALGRLSVLAPLWGLAICVTAISSISLRPAASPSDLDRAWLDFRNMFGALWAMRVKEQVNATASLCGWGTAIHWGGFRSPSLPADERRGVGSTLKNLLRRFVSRQWLASRLEETVAPSGLSDSASSE